MKTDEYLTSLTEQIRCKMARETVQEEIRGHIEDQMEAFLDEGMSREEAENAAVAQMGDPVEAGSALDRIHRPRMAWGMIALVGILGTAGLLIQYLLQQQSTENQFAAIDFGRQAWLLALSFLVMILVCFADYTRIGVHAKAITVALFMIILAAMTFFSVPVNGAKFWLVAPWGIPFSINVQMLVLLFAPLYGAVLYTYRGRGYDALLPGLLWMLPGMFPALMIPSMMTAVTLFFSYVIVLSAAVAKGWFKVKRKAVLPALWSGVILLPVTVCFVVLNHTGGYRTERIRALVDSESPMSYQLRAVRQMIAGSNWLGTGSGTPLAGEVSDFTLTYTIYYYGILAGILLVSLILFLFLRFFRISFRQKNQLGMIMGTGCSAVLMVQLAMYLAGNLGLINLSSYCPFLNYGGSGMVVSSVLYGLLLSIYRYEKVMPETWVKKRAVPWSGLAGKKYE